MRGAAHYSSSGWAESKFAGSGMFLTTITHCTQVDLIRGDECLISYASSRNDFDRQHAALLIAPQGCGDQSDWWPGVEPIKDPSKASLRLRFSRRKGKGK